MMIGRCVAVGLAVLAVAGSAQAAPYTAEYVFGDSLSDNGNLAEGLYKQNFPNPPSFQNSFTNGPVAASLLASRLGLSLTPSLWVTGFQDINGLYGPSFRPGTNFAVAAATAAAAPVGGVPGINLPQQVLAYGLSTGGRADPNALYVIDIGGNDVRNAALQGTGATAVTTGVQTELTQIATLAAAGARSFLVVNVPNVGIIPEFVQDNPALAALATTYSQQYDQALASGLAALRQSTGASLTAFDLYSFNTNLLATAGALGFTDTTDRCYTGTPLSAATSPQCGANAANINSFFYWDAIHPSARVQALWATGFETALNVPEPSSLALIGVGLAGMLARRRSRHAVSAIG